MHDQNNVFYAVALSLVILITWQYSSPPPFLANLPRPRPRSPG
jgi:hypothetical protein